MAFPFGEQTASLLFLTSVGAEQIMAFAGYPLNKEIFALRNTTSIPTTVQVILTAEEIKLTLFLGAYLEIVIQIKETSCKFTRIQI